MPSKPRPHLRKSVSEILELRNFRQLSKSKNMAKTVSEYKTEIVKTLKRLNSYSTALDMQIVSLASAMRNLEMANDQIDGLTETTVWETTRYGEKLAPHPVFKIAKEAQELITRQMKALGLTAEDLAGDVEDDPLAELTKKLSKKRKQPKIIKPTE